MSDLLSASRVELGLVSSSKLLCFKSETMREVHMTGHSNSHVRKAIGVFG